MYFLLYKLLKVLIFTQYGTTPNPSSSNFRKLKALKKVQTKKHRFEKKAAQCRQEEATCLQTVTQVLDALEQEIALAQAVRAFSKEAGWWQNSQKVTKSRETGKKRRLLSVENSSKRNRDQLTLFNG